MKNIIVFVNILLIVSTGNTFAQYTKWERDVSIDNIHFTKLRYTIKNGDTIKAIGILKQDTEIGKDFCKKGWVHLNMDNNPVFFCTAKEFKYGSQKIPANSWIVDRDKKSLTIVLPTDTTIQNYMCKGGGGGKGPRTSFYKSGKIHFFFSPEDIVVDSCACSGGLFAPIELYESGKLKSCRMQKKKTDTLYPHLGKIIYLDEKGNRIKKM